MSVLQPVGIACVTMCVGVLQPVGIACVTMCVGVLQPVDSVPVGVHMYIVYCVAWSVTIHWTRLPLPFQPFFGVGEKLIMFIQPTSLLNLLP